MDARFGRAAAWALGLSVLAAIAGPAVAQGRGDKAYTVANYPVDASADNAVTAKERALADGEQAALRSLLKRLVPVTSYGRLKSLSQVKAGELLQGFSIRSERNSSTQYIASLDFSFDASAVRALLRREGIAYVDSQASQAVVVPLLRGKDGIEPAGSPLARQWLEAWAGLDLEHALTPVRLGEPRARPSPDAIRRLVAGDLGGIGPLAAEFRSDFTVLALAEPDPAARRLHVWIAGNDASGPIHLKRSYRLGGDTAYALELAAVISLGIIEGRWKARTGRDSDGIAAIATAGDALELMVEFRSRAQWEQMLSRLERLQGAEDVDVLALSQRRARLAMRYPGGIVPLAQVVETQGMTLVQGDGGWILRPLQ